MMQNTEAPTVLIVDDTPSNLGMVVELMEGRGYQVCIAQDGEEGLQRAQLLQPDLILLDVMMPGADGFEICRRLKMQEATRDIPVIFMTALASPEHKVAGFAAGGVDYLTKPLYFEEVMARVDTHIRLHAAQRQLEKQNLRLEKHGEELELLVATGTAELGDANCRLREEVEERERDYRRMALLDFALAHVTEDVFLIDRHGMFRYVNEHACRQLGYPRGTLLGMGVADIDPDWTKERYAVFWPQLRERGSITLETRHQACDGRIFPVEVDANYFEYEGGGYNLTLVRDITERKLAEEALAASEREFRTLAENLPDNLARYDKQCRIVYLNPQLESLLGEKIATKLGKTPIESHPGPVYVEYQARLAETIATGQPCELELVLPGRGDGVQYHHILFVAERDASGEIVGALTIGRDITDLKFVERELEESRAQLRGMTARREELREEERKYIAREVYDELGQILTGLQLNISVLEHKFAPELPPLLEHMKETRVLMDRALGVARNVASSLRPAVLDMGIVSALEWLTGRFGANTGILCQIHVDENEIQMDERHAIVLFRILQESLTNISRHAQATRVDVTFLKEGVDCCLKVCDNGKGFVMNEKKMDSFGLVSIKERVLMLRGCVVIESSPGKGTQIDVRIPINEKVLIHD